MNQVVVDLWPQDMLLRLGRTSINTLVVNGTLNIIHIAVKVPINHHRCAQELNCCTERRRWIAIDKGIKKVLAEVSPVSHRSFVLLYKRAICN